MTTEKFQRLLEGYLNGRLSNRRLERFLAALDEPVHQEQVLQYLETKLQETTTMPDREFADKGYTALLELVSSGMHDPGSGVLYPSAKQRIGMRVFSYAAIVVGILIVTGICYQLANRQRHSATFYGKGKAAREIDTLHHTYIVFADGGVIVLDSLAEKSERLRELGATVDYEHSRVSFPTAGQPFDTSLATATLVTPRGRQFSIVLSDGSVVWLNALSRLQFPLRFIGQQRSLSLNGEGYFDVAPDSTHPFRLAAGTVAITVLGTQFNVHAYAGEPSLHATLLRGKVEITGEKRQTALVEGQTLQITGAGWKVLRAADTAQAVAWKQQLFDFRKADLQVILPELSRWYDITYEITPGFHKTFTGKIPRTADIATVLQILAESGIRYRKEGKKIVFFR